MAASFPRYHYIISKYLDPVFALTIGVSAAVVRIRREEREKGRDVAETVRDLRRRFSYTVFGGQNGLGEGVQKTG